MIRTHASFERPKVVWHETASEMENILASSSVLPVVYSGYQHLAMRHFEYSLEGQRQVYRSNGFESPFLYHLDLASFWIDFWAQELLGHLRWLEHHCGGKPLLLLHLLPRMNVPAGK